MAKNKKRNSDPQQSGPTQPGPRKLHRARMSIIGLRKALGLSQQELATLLGSSVALIQGIESNRPVSRDISAKIQARLGVMRESVEGDSDMAGTLLGEPVSKEAVERVRNDQPSELTEVVFAEFTNPLIKLIRAAHKDKKLRAFAATYRDMLVELRDNVGLESTLHESLRPVVRMTWGQFRKAPGFKSEWDDPKKSNDDEIQVPVPNQTVAEAWFDEPNLIRDAQSDLKSLKKAVTPQPGK